MRRRKMFDWRTFWLFVFLNTFIGNRRYKGNRSHLKGPGGFFVDLLCIVYVSYKDIKKVVADLKKIYSAVTLEEAEKNLQTFAEIWRKQYPSCVKSWEENWPVLSTFFEYPVEIWKIIYTTNIIEGLNRRVCPKFCVNTEMRCK